MAHEVDFTTGKAAFAFVGNRQAIWHGLGEQVAENATLGEIMVAARATWQATSGALSYRLDSGEFRTITDQRALYRSDTGDLLGIVSATRYNVVQPREIFEFFRDFLADNKLSISSAGVFKRGRVVICNAALGDDYRINVMGVDPTEHYLTLVTSYDGSLATTAYLTGLRTVCNNTLMFNMSSTEKAGRQWRTAHSQEFNGTALQAAVGFFGRELAMRADVWNALADRRVSDDDAHAYFAELLDINLTQIGRTDENGKPLVATVTANRLKALVDAYKNGPGTGLKTAEGTAYGLLNAVTYFTDHKARTRDTQNEGEEVARAFTANFGAGRALKAKALAAARKLVAA